MRDRPGSAPPQQGGAGVGDSAPAATYTLPEFPYIQFPLPDLVPPPASLLKVDAKMAAASHGMIVNTFHDLEGRYIYRALETTQWAQQRLARRATVLVPSTIILGRSRCQARLDAVARREGGRPRWSGIVRCAWDTGIHPRSATQRGCCRPRTGWCGFSMGSAAEQCRPWQWVRGTCHGGQRMGGPMENPPARMRQGILKPLRVELGAGKCYRRRATGQ
jgi:hypothetical protein